MSQGSTLASGAFLNFRPTTYNISTGFKESVSFLEQLWSTIMPPKDYIPWKLRSAAEEIDRRAAKGTLRSPTTSSSSSSSSSGVHPSSSNSPSAGSTGSASPLPSAGRQKLPSRKSRNKSVPSARPASQSALPCTSTAQPSSGSVARPSRSKSPSKQSVPAVAENAGSLTSQTVGPRAQAEKIAEINKLDREKEVICDELGKLEIQIGKQIKKRDDMITRGMKNSNAV
ncbi:hypothetical protein GJ744_005259 [Endocarpon pusillum]|uniref:Uncharacterized protein n=1 Tax=Endocarpon pusillum TaxID=364733 RepID=A0A8H7A4V7_9EURO|nr:hypothetical protein GJ744_005259 [Endocarpon pusillum]